MAFNPGGVCHMGRLLRLSHTNDDKNILQRCISKQDKVECRAFQKQTDTQDYTVFDKLPPFTYSAVNSVGEKMRKMRLRSTGPSGRPTPRILCATATHPLTTTLRANRRVTCTTDFLGLLSPSDAEA